MKKRFRYDDRLDIELPDIEEEWLAISQDERTQILYEWEIIRGTIPNRIQKREAIIIEKQNQLHQENNFTISCELNTQIANLASQINDLHLWFRTNQDVESKIHSG